jgi:RecG-like helicase
MIDLSAHQGDVYVKKTKIPKDVEEKKFEKNEVILAYGEVTGHKHRFETDNVKMFVATDRSGKTYILIYDYPAVLKHEEHEEIKFLPGEYEVFIARQWTDAEEPIAVRD